MPYGAIKAMATREDEIKLEFPLFSPGFKNLGLGAEYPDILSMPSR